MHSSYPEYVAHKSRPKPKSKKNPAKKAKKITAPKRSSLSCVEADLFADCFAGCSGVISAGFPGPVCGWTFSTAFGTTGTIEFSSGQMALKGSSGDVAAAVKTLPASLSSVLDLSGKYSFTEFQASLGTGQAYEFWITNTDNSESILVFLDDFGNALVQVGPTALTSSYLGTWTPNNGSHVVFFTVDENGLPHLYIDGNEVALEFVGESPSAAELLPANVVAVDGAVFDGANETSPWTSIFLASGVLSPTTEFCCPT